MSKVIAADGRLNSWSRFGGTGLLRPSNMSRRPMTLSLLAQLAGQHTEAVEPRLELRVRGEQRGEARATAGRQRRCEEERVERLSLAQVLGRDSPDVAGDL